MFSFVLAIFTVKLVMEMLGRWGENCYLTGRPYTAACLITLVVGASIPVGRMVIADRDNWAAGAMLAAVFLTTMAGCKDLQRRRKPADEQR